MIEIAKEVVRTLFDEGYVAYFAGGWVRDYLLGISSQEIDIATSAPPEKIASLFPKTIPVGIEFGVVIVVHKNIPFEVTTFRKDHPYNDGRHPEGVDFSTPEKDALRRDFTINGMFYDPLTDELHDFVKGQVDLKAKIIRAIGNPSERFQEDRLRMLRAVRFATRFGFQIEKETEQGIKKFASTLLPSVSIERVWQELTKMSRYPHFDQALATLFELGLLTTIFPTLTTFSTPNFSNFPKDTPTIAYLLELFPNTSLEERIALCRTLKTAQTDIKLVEFFTHSQTISTKIEWTYFYAHPLSSLFLEIQKAKLPLSEKEKFHEEHSNRKKELLSHIKRIEEKRPLLTAAHLQKEGIQPGKTMGILLKEGEALVIHENLDSSDAAIALLKKSPSWPR